MQSRIDSLCQLCSVQGTVKETVYVAALVCSCQQVVEAPHVQFSTFDTEIRVVDVGLGYGVYLRISEHHSG